ncbi:MAG: replication-relaxation family protein, partial [Planctomycetes bacterium]|nr:replication-relaxation family protein [Planctomycetota bacterium]
MLRLLSWTPLTTSLLLRVSTTLPGEPFTNERRLRERLQALAAAGFVRRYSAAQAKGGLQNYYKLAPNGWHTLHGSDVALPPKAFFAEISPSLFEHTLTLAEVIAAVIVAAHVHRVTILNVFRENELTFAVGDRQIQPDCFMRFSIAGKNFSVAFEVDLSTESVNSNSQQSLRRKLQTYDAYQSFL